MKSSQPDKRLFNPTDIHTTFKKISDRDLHPLGLSDDPTQKASDNVRRCENEATPAHLRVLASQCHVAPYIDKDIARTSGLPAKSLIHAR
ncbi:DNA-directed RNA polymerase subunit [Mycena indigotica]|uniref:DNA-directed RNA polymerase subunit n=1 Tax=Mycena indigotica TaxID=2126181 RepID=A0A8H6S7Z0_9AGAR|nr:DNA-directed RNA polymerase subunit [Mycena indigotica]KAF7293442.1 DNA-directed RNA polymerase subunit [Mycena indigotica]